MLDEAWRLGIRAFDTARVYGDGESERLIGEWLSGACDGHSAVVDAELVKLRRQAVIITKGGCGEASSFWRPNLCPQSLRAELQESLDRLHGKIDIYMLHRDEIERDVGDIVETMHSFVTQGLVKAWGVSNWRVDRIDAVLRYAHAHGLEPPRYSSLQDSLAMPAREPWPGTVFMNSTEQAWYERHPEIAVLGWECLGKGFLAGRWSRDDAPSYISDDALEDVYSNEWRENRLKRAYLTETNFARRERAVTLARARGGYRPEQVAIAWCLVRPYTSHVITATVNPRHLRKSKV